MCNEMYENVKSLDYTKKSLQSDSDPATMKVVTRTNAVKSPTNSPETTKLVYTVKEWIEERKQQERSKGCSTPPVQSTDLTVWG